MSNELIDMIIAYDVWWHRSVVRLSCVLISVHEYAYLMGTCCRYAEQISTIGGDKLLCFFIIVEEKLKQAKMCIKFIYQRCMSKYWAPLYWYAKHITH